MTRSALRSAGPLSPPLSSAIEPPDAAFRASISSAGFFTGDGAPAADATASTTHDDAKATKAVTVSAALPAASLDALLHRADLWRGAGLAGSPRQTIASGFAALDAELPGGGWPAGAAIELLSGDGIATKHVTTGNGALSLLLPAIARLTRAGRWVALIAPPLRIHAPAWALADVDLAHLLHVDAADAATRAWACERCLRSGAVAAVVAWPGALSFAQRKRLQLAAETGGSSLFALLPGGLAAQSSPAPLRLVCEARREGLGVRILKRRGASCERRLILPLARPLPARRRSPPTPLTTPDEVIRHALAGTLATRPATDRAPRPAAA